MQEKQTVHITHAISEGKTFLGIELGSTRIKAVLIDDAYTPIAAGGYEWENRLNDGLWTYHLDDVRAGLQASFKNLQADVKSRYGITLNKTGAIGISAMMHGYLAFDKKDNLLVPFRTWRNTTTETAAAELTGLFQFNIPQRWSVAHLYQAVLNQEPHVKDIAFLTTLAGYVHWKLTGKKVIGLGDASGMFPIDSGTNTFNALMMEQFNSLIKSRECKWKGPDIFPEVLNAGEPAGSLTAEGAALLDPSGALQPGIVLCPPEGDAGTGMVGTNSVAPRTGNVSAGTSIFAMIVLEKGLSKVYREIDMVTSPSGKPVAMVHCNSCTSDLDAWIKLFAQAIALSGGEIEKSALYDALYNTALEGDPDCGGLLSYNCYSGEPVAGLDQGRPLFARKPDSRFTLPNFMRSLLFSALGTLKLGMDILTEKEQVRLDRLLGHGGLFKTKNVGQRLMAGALNTPVGVMDSAGEGGSWGIALLAAYRSLKHEGDTLETWLAGNVFAPGSGVNLEPDPKDVQGFQAFMKRYAEGLHIEQAAVNYLQ
ncbi:MAG: FGGY-family carbohydrate kinase [Treponema sp.]|jgi:sugar (pentulose or hexulose) kinase|nr:FGGY-family carbohydrate kinase [Treponema sp.]